MVSRRVVHVTHSKTQHDEFVVPPLVKNLILYVPLALLFQFLVTTQVVHHLHDRHVVPYLNAVKWTDERQHEEDTYYYFRCNATDITALEPEPLLASENLEKTIDTVMLHGMAFFPDILDEQESLRFREFILERNMRIRVEENIPVIGHVHRWSFGLGATEDSSIPQVLKSIATNRLLTETMEELLGKNPAVVEMSTITSAEGAAMQNWHQDTKAGGGRSFVNLYTLLIPLQDTLPTMGPTWVCPGVHRCVSAPPCHELGFPIYNRTLGYWKAGSGILYNSRALHRGGAHMGGPERVALVMSYASRPDFPETPAIYSRSLPLGSVYAIRRDMWGHTWNDLRDAERYMAPPLSTLRSLGIWKEPGGDWGWTWFQAVCLKMVNDQFGFRFMDLESFLKNRIGIIGKLPFFLQGRVELRPDIAPWHLYLLDVLKNLRQFALILNVIVLSAVFGIGAANCVTTKKYDSLRTTVTWVGVTHGLTIFLAVLLVYRIDNSSWGQGSRHGSMGPFEPSLHDVTESYMNALVAPDYQDVLLGKRLQVPYLAAHAQFLDYHPGNRRWQEAADASADRYVHYRSLPTVFQEAVSRSVVEATRTPKGYTFLKDTEHGDWMEMPEVEVIQRTNGLLFQKWLRGKNQVVYRGGVQAIELNRCSDIDAAHFLFPKDRISDLSGSARSSHPNTQFRIQPVATTQDLRSKKNSIPTTREDVSLRVGDRVDGLFKGRKWLPGTLVSVNTNDGSYNVMYYVGNLDERLKPEFVRKRRDRTPKPMRLDQVELRCKSRVNI